MSDAVIHWAYLVGASGILAFAALFAYLLTPPTALILAAELPKPQRTPSPDANPEGRVGLDQMVALHAQRTGKRYVVIGTGNVGMTLVEALIQRGETNVIGFDRAQPSRMPPSNFTFIRGDVTNYAEVLAALKDADVCFATFAIIRYHERLPADYAASHAVNVVGTERVLQACAEQSVPFLIQTSTSHVCLPATANGEQMIAQDAPYVSASSAMSHYSWTKAQAEQLVRAANGTPLRNGGKLATLALRPCSGIFGPRDGLIAQNTLKKAHESGKILSVATGKIDYVFAQDLVYAELLGERKLREEPSLLGGQALNICAEEPISGIEFDLALAFYYEQATKRKVKQSVGPLRLLNAIALGVETVAWLTGLKAPGDLEKLTPIMLQTAAMSYTFDGAKARKLLGYEPIYTMDEALRLTVREWLKSNV